MADFLSEAWIQELAVAAADAPGLATGEAEFVVEQVVQGGPNGDVRYRLSLGPVGAVITVGDASAEDLPAPDLALITDFETARALHLGALRAQDALAAGALKVRGSPEGLARAADALAVLDVAFGAARRRTTFPDGGGGGASTAER